MTTAVRAVVAGMGARSRELRLLTREPRLTGGEVQVLSGVDCLDHEAELATSASDGAPVAIARFGRSDDESAAEVALGVRRFSADVAPDRVAA